MMHKLTVLALSAVAATCLTVATPPPAQAQVSVNIGVAPECPYGYYSTAPYNCAPYGYYSPQWFTGGVFIGAGPWFHGHEDFRGPVDSRYDPAHGYKGPWPARGEKPAPENHYDNNPHFKGNEMRDGRGHEVK